ncbi:MAG TPA: glycosyltransferase [Spirochaetales bacterium]|nr:glycosyltransferase [Spirochaetales bacterium]
MTRIEDRERVLFLYLPTGGGHLSNCKAISRRVAERYGAETLAYDPVSARSPLGKLFLEGGYRFMSLRLPWMWNLLFELNDNPFIMRLSQGSARRFSRYGLRYIIDEWKPTRIVCLHHLLSPAVAAALEGREPIPVTVVATDPFVPPKLWAHGHEYPIVCMSEEARDSFLAMGVDESRLRTYSIIIGEKFERRMDEEARAAFKRSVGLDPERPLVLIAGGGDGMRGADRILDELCSSSLDYQVALVCGRDERTRKRAEAKALEYRIRGRRVVVFGFTDRMYELMESADAIVSKAGPAVLGEVLAAGKPNVIAFYIPGQEKPNVRWVEEKGVGVYCPEPARMRAVVERLLTDDEYRAGMEDAIGRLGFKNGLYEIAEAVMSTEALAPAAPAGQEAL